MPVYKNSSLQMWLLFIISIQTNGKFDQKLRLGSGLKGRGHSGVQWALACWSSIQDANLWEVGLIKCVSSWKEKVLHMYQKVEMYGSWFYKIILFSYWGNCQQHLFIFVYRMQKLSKSYQCKLVSAPFINVSPPYGHAFKWQIEK